MSIEIIYNNNPDTENFAVTLNSKLAMNGLSEVITLKSENLNPDTIQGIIIIAILSKSTEMILESVVKSIKETMRAINEYSIDTQIKTKDKTYNNLAEAEEEIERNSKNESENNEE